MTKPRERTYDGLFKNSDGFIVDNINYYLLKLPFAETLHMYVYGRCVNYDFPIRHIDEVERLIPIKYYRDLPNLLRKILYNGWRIIRRRFR